MFQQLAGELRSIHTLVTPLHNDPGAAGASPSKK
jgi:hypothetical protein